MQGQTISIRPISHFLTEALKSRTALPHTGVHASPKNSNSSLNKQAIRHKCYEITPKLSELLRLYILILASFQNCHWHKLKRLEKQKQQSIELTKRVHRKKKKSRASECPKRTKVSKRTRMYGTVNWSKKFKDAALMYSSLELSLPN